MMRERLGVYIEQHRQQITSKTAEMLQVLSCCCLGNAPLQHEILLALGACLNLDNGLIRLHQVLKSATHVHSEVDLLIEDGGKELGKGLVKSRLQVQRKLAVTR